MSNATGANLTSGIAPILATAQSPGLAVLEVDERVLPRVVDPLGVELLVLGNLSRDQLDRYGEVHAVGDLWRNVAETHPDLRVVANASDPHVVWAATPAKTTWVELGLGWRNDAATCPNCAALLRWSADRFDCPSCGFGQPATPNRLDGDTLVLDGTRVPLRLALPGRWNLANAALAVTAAATHFGVDPGEAAEAAATVTTVAGRYMTVALPDGRRARVLLAKNPAGWSEVLHHLSVPPPARRNCSVVIAVNARVADGKDPSWLWDVPYELLRGQPVAAAGERAFDVAVRLRYAEVDHIVERDPWRPRPSCPATTSTSWRRTPSSRRSTGSSDERGVRVRGARRSRLSRAARDVRRPRQRGGARAAAALAGPRRRAGRGRRGRADPGLARRLPLRRRRGRPAGDGVGGHARARAPRSTADAPAARSCSPCAPASSSSVTATRPPTAR